jgi:hypothetical protein
MNRRVVRDAKARVLIAATFGAVCVPIAAVETNPYAGQQTRAVKSLSEDEIGALLAGQGSGYAKAAELNGYPGPAHVLELAERLHLSEGQLQATRGLMQAHRTRARALGERLVAAETDLDRLFATKAAAPGSVDAATERIALLQAQLRAEHLKTHLAQTRLLDAEQLRRYAELRGYATDGRSVPDHGHSGHGGGGRP